MVRAAANLTLVLTEGGGFQAWIPQRPGIRIPLDPDDVRLLADVAGKSGPPLDPTEARVARLAELGLLEGVGRAGAPPRAAVDDAPIFVFGAPRSGTTVMRAILDAHPRISCGDESMFVAALLDCHNSWKFRRPLLNYGVTDAQILEFWKSFILFAHGELAARRGKARWADKTPAYSSMADFIHTMFEGSARYVILVRHALDAAMSMERMVIDGFWDSSLAGFVDGRSRSEHTLENAARVWARLSESLQRFHLRHEGLLVIRYEELVTEPAAVIGRLFRYLGEEVPAGFADQVFARPLDHGPMQLGQGDPGLRAGARTGFDPSSIGRWKTMTRALVRSVADIVNPGLEYWGYERV